MALNNIGLHAIGGLPVALSNGSAKPTIVKLVDVGTNVVTETRAQVGADCLIVIRFYEEYQPLASPIMDAARWFAKHKPYIELTKGKNVVFVGYCEIADTNAIQYSIFETERGRLLHSIGASCGYLEASVGTPDLPVWTTYQTMLNTMLPGDYVCLHEYWSDNADIDNRWHCGRWTMVPQLVGKPIAITECGRDIVEGKGQPGWQRTTDANGFMADLRKYSALVSQYPNVKGATVFQAGSADQQWASFNVAGIWPQVVSEYAAIVTPPVIPPPTNKLVIDGRRMNEQQFRKHINALIFTEFKPIRVYLHHTAIPTLTSWNGAITIEAMRRTYEGYGWNAGPHLFVAPDGIWLFTPLNKRGIGVTDHNAGSWHLEMVGNYNEMLPAGKVLELTLWALKLVFNKAGLPYSGLLFHRDDEMTSCPGTAVSHGWFIGKLTQAMQLAEGLPNEETATDAKTLVQKARWWMEEWERTASANFAMRADEIRLSLIDLMYRAENSL